MQLRPYQDDKDFNEIYRLTSNPAAMRYIRTPDTEPATCRNRINGMLAYRANNPDFGIQMIENDEGIIIGNMILRHANWDATREIEIGYVIDPAHWGKGYATQAIGLLIQYAEQLGITFLVAFTDLDNGASNRVLEKWGFIQNGEETIYEAICLRWERTKTP